MRKNINLPLAIAQRLLAVFFTLLVLALLPCLARAATIGIDAGHGNYFISGASASQCTSLQQMCQNTGYTTQLLSEELTYDAIKDDVLLILTVPYGSQASAFSPQELQALAMYAQNGGNILLAAKSDRFDPSDYALSAATLTNSVLTAVGAHSSVESGIVVDPSNHEARVDQIQASGTSLFRSDGMMQGALQTLQLQGSQNSGFYFENAAPLHVEESEAAQVDVLLQASTTTWATTYTGVFIGSGYIPDDTRDPVVVAKGNVILATCETLSGGGWIVTCASPFFSDSSLAKPSCAANALFLQTLLLSLPSVSCTDLISVRSLPDGVEVLVRGTLSTDCVDYDEETAFPHGMYIQDTTGAIQITGATGAWRAGMQVALRGRVSRREDVPTLQLQSDQGSWMLLQDANLSPLSLQKISAVQAMTSAQEGAYVELSGTVESLSPQSSGEGLLQMKDFLGTGWTVSLSPFLMQELYENVQIGSTVTCRGIAVETSGHCLIRPRNTQDLCWWADTSQQFVDVDKHSWYYPSLQYVVHMGRMLGTSATHFSPETVLTRAQLVTILYRLEQVPERAWPNAFQDVPPGKWYTAPIAWAAESGIVNGMGNGRFCPDTAISREQIAAILYRYATFKGYDTCVDDTLSFPDSNLVSGYARQPIQWCAQHALITGIRGQLAPKALATRAQFATILMRFESTCPF